MMALAWPSFSFHSNILSSTFSRAATEAASEAPPTPDQAVGCRLSPVTYVSSRLLSRAICVSPFHPPYTASFNVREEDDEDFSSPLSLSLSGMSMPRSERVGVWEGKQRLSEGECNG